VNEEDEDKGKSWDVAGLRVGEKNDVGGEKAMRNI